jgi:hypothetical protein
MLRSVPGDSVSDGWPATVTVQSTISEALRLINVLKHIRDEIDGYAGAYAKRGASSTARR